MKPIGRKQKVSGRLRLNLFEDTPLPTPYNTSLALESSQLAMSGITKGNSAPPSFVKSPVFSPLFFPLLYLSNFNQLHLRFAV